MKRQEFVALLVRGAKYEPQLRGEAFAPSNIALCKYWGKRNAELNLPVNSSLSISLGNLGTRTIITGCEEVDRVTLNGSPAPTDFAMRLSAYLNLFRSRGQFFDVQTENTIPTAAGLASSASGFAALVVALDQLMGWGLDRQKLSMLARLGSGSASRSLFEGFAIWNAGQLDTGADSYAEGLPVTWSDLRVGVLEVSKAQKPTGSTDGMNRTRETSSLYQAWPQQASRDLDLLRNAIAEKDFSLMGKTAEHNAMAMHATMIAAWPPLCYWQPQSLALMQTVWKARADGLELYFTLDAGPNLKLLFLASNQSEVEMIFPGIQVIAPFEN